MTIQRNTLFRILYLPLEWLSVTRRGGHEAVAVEGHVVVGVLGHLRLLVAQAAQSAGGAGVLLAATLSLYCTDRTVSETFSTYNHII